MLRNLGMQYMFNRGISRFKELRVIDLNFEEDTEITSMTARAISRSLPRSRYLERLRLSFRRCKKVSDNAPRYLTDGLCELFRLKELKLDFGKIGACPKGGFIHFFDKGFINLKKLIILKIDLESGEYINSEVLQSLCFGVLKPNKNL